MLTIHMSGHLATGASMWPSLFPSFQPWERLCLYIPVCFPWSVPLVCLASSNHISQSSQLLDWQKLQPNSFWLQSGNNSFITPTPLRSYGEFCSWHLMSCLPQFLVSSHFPYPIWSSLLPPQHLHHLSLLNQVSCLHWHLILCLLQLLLPPQFLHPSQPLPLLFQCSVKQTLLPPPCGKPYQASKKEHVQ